MMNIKAKWYAVTVDRASGIRNDPSDESDDPRYIVDLLKRVVRGSLESVYLVAESPLLHEKSPICRPDTGKIAVKVINHYVDEVLKVFGVG